jgi:putative aldouronate transport system permease protein
MMAAEAPPNPDGGRTTAATTQTQHVGAARARPVGVTRRPRAAYLIRAWPLYLMLVPGLIILALFNYYPMYGVIIAFENYNPGLGFLGSPWVGLQNFQDLFAQADFFQVVRNTLVISLAKIVTVQVSAIGLALLLNGVRVALFKRTVQTIVYIPHFLSWVVLGGILIDVLSPTGLVNQVLGFLHLAPIFFLGSNTTFVPTVIVTNLWKEVGFATIVYLAALLGIDSGLYEAAAIDGANRWQRTLHVTLPGIVPTIVVVGALNLGSLLQAGFDQILNLYNPAVYQTGDILDTYIYRAGLVSGQYSQAAAVGLIQSLVGFVLILVAFGLARRFAGYEIF